MLTFNITNPVIPFYPGLNGSRLLFTHGKTNPRDLIGKNGVDIHGRWLSFFYKTIRVKARVKNHQGEFKEKLFYINRNSLIKYLGKESEEPLSDSELIDFLNNLTNQINESGNDLRHAGTQKQPHIHRWYHKLIDNVRAFLRWFNNKPEVSKGMTAELTKKIQGEADLKIVTQSLQSFVKSRFDNARYHRRYAYISTFADETLTTESNIEKRMQAEGSIFATRPDKVRIIEQLNLIAGYEAQQLENAVNKIKLSIDEKSLITTKIENTFRFLLKYPKRDLEAALFNEFCKDSEGRRAVIDHWRSILDITLTLNKDRRQIIIAGTPRFLKELTDEMEAQDLDFASLSAIGIVCDEEMSETTREQLKKGGFSQIYSSYDSDINWGIETDYGIALRKMLEKNQHFASEFYGRNKGVPLVLHYDPERYHAECDNADQLTLTNTRIHSKQHLLNDKARVYDPSDVQALLAKYGVFHKPSTDLPFMFVWRENVP